jgi:hypothetical protein
MIKTVRTLPLAAAFAILAACRTDAVQTEQPARIVDADDASRAALSAAVNHELNSDVLLAADALTNSDLLIIDRRKADRIGAEGAQGRIMEHRPIQFRLVIEGEDCILVDTRDQSRTRLTDTRCVPIG